MFRSLPSPGYKCLALAILASCSLIFGYPLLAQDPPPQNPAPPATAPPAQEPRAKPAATDSAQSQPVQEVSSQDSPATFKVRVNNVLVRVVVRDSHGKVVPNLKKEDFQLFDGRKLQNITSFTVETPRTSTVPLTPSPASENSPAVADPAVAVKAAALPQRFVAMVFDDVHMSMDDAVFVRDSATRFFGALAPGDRVAMNTTSGQLTQDYTDDHALLAKTLLGIVPHPSTHHDTSDCPDMSYYEADLIVNKNDPQAAAVAAAETLQCAFNNDPTQQAAAAVLAKAAAYNALSEGDAETQYAYRHLEDIVRRMTSLPGQRILVLVSPGFILSTLQYEASSMIDRATRANIVINTIDARGLYTPDFGDIANPPRDTLLTGGFKSTYRVAAQSAQEDVLAELADGTGGTFYHNRNDVDEAMRQAGAAPDVSYLLSFSPQNLKFDGRFHTLKVALATKEKFNIQARRGYFAPRSAEDPAEISKEEIQEALFSQEEIHDIPVDLQTQYFKQDAAQARLAVLTHLDVKGVRFRKNAGRNNDQLTIVTGIFDENGQFVTGQQKTIDMKLLDSTYERLTRSGLTVKSSFAVKPGTYLVRLVIRDAEGAQMAARNGAVVIPN